MQESGPEPSSRSQPPPAWLGDSEQEPKAPTALSAGDRTCALTKPSPKGPPRFPQVLGGSPGPARDRQGGTRRPEAAAALRTGGHTRACCVTRGTRPRRALYLAAHARWHPGVTRLPQGRLAGFQATRLAHRWHVKSIERVTQPPRCPVEPDEDASHCFTAFVAQGPVHAHTDPEWSARLAALRAEQSGPPRTGRAPRLH